MSLLAEARSPAMLPIDERRTVGFLIADVARMMRAAFDRRVRRIGLTRAQWQVLAILHRRPGLSQSELAEMLEVERATAGRLIDRLEQKGWVLRRRDPADRRTYRLHLTDAAETVQAEMGRIAAEMIDDAMAALHPGEREALTEMLGRVKTQLLAMPPRTARASAPRTAPARQAAVAEAAP
ncbi:MAG: MarR family transcriptional regulator [Acetobacteraceae bacterium]|nr:MarR family transcriptional regulator [Acetobacteraceae bacterium]